MRYTLILYLIAGWLLVSCDQNIQPPLRVASHEWPGYEPLHLARELGYFDERAIHIYETPSATSSIRAFRNGYIDVAALTLDESLLLLQDQIAAKVLLVMDISNGADAVLARPPRQTLAELKGARVGLESMALGAYMLTRTLALAGLTEEDIETVYVPFNEHLNAYQNKDIDAIVTFEPAKGKIIQAGANVLLDSRQLKNEIIDVLVIRESALFAHQESVKQLVDGWFKALDTIRQNPKEAAAKIAQRINASPDDFLISLQDIVLPTREQNLAFLSGEEPTLPQIADQLAKVMIQQRLLLKTVNTQSLLYSQMDQLIGP
jgi:NitT/TauT family transport system substrate-binding protein